MLVTILDVSGSYSTVQLRELAAKRLAQIYGLDIEHAKIVAGESVDQMQRTPQYVREALVNQVVSLAEKKLAASGLQKKLSAQQII